ncbi:TonB-dependent receptor [Dyadobacter sp. LHD-138]|uniref:TonB-dependent receptor n=1 Tax=Dyadobacter sp. LHD-138 TaxID=3071413 RepID=UPI0027DFBC8E|nr:TonB-dependent receptor [Dyadobacter sp. LHD-138]MDQ6477142.1 TonB-dependent receptor [Dyadobacter sp. LHD-138]
MKNSVLFSRLALKFVRLTFMQLMLSALLVSVVSAREGKTQELLNQRITIKKKQETIKSILLEIEKSLDVKFLYSSNILNPNQKITFSVKNETLGAVLTKILKPLDLGYEVSDKQIIIKPILVPLEQKRQASLTTSARMDSLVKGIVIDEKGEALPGVNVLLKGTQRGTVTDEKGNFSIDVSDAVRTLVFSYVGFLSQEVDVNNASSLKISLLADQKSLEEVVVVGYGTQKRSSILGSVASVSADEIKAITSSNIVNGLAGKLPGLRVTQRTSEPGAYNTAFDIRGYGAALIVVDGVVRDDFNRFDPNEIESISVLKDASAAVYGIKAANGVVLVTTKKGSTSGKPVITYSTKYEIAKILKMPEVGDAYQFAVLTTENEIFQGKGIGSTTFSKEDIEKFKDGTYPSTDWLDVAFNKYGNLMHHNLNVTGGNDKVKYFASAGYLNEMGLYKSKDLNYQKYNVRSSVSINLTDNLSAQLNIDAMSENRNESSYPAANVMHYTWMNKPTFSTYANNTAPYMQDFSYPFHPIAVTTADIGGYRKTKTLTVQANASVDYKFRKIEGLKLRGMFSYYTRPSFEKLWNKRYSVYTYDPLTETYLETGVQNSPSRLTGNYFTLNRSTMMGQADYSKTFADKHNLNVALVYEQRREQTDNMSATKEFAIDVDQFFAGVSANAQINSGNIYENANKNFIGRVNYNFSSKYLVEAGFNYGASSRFPSESRWGFFPFVSGGWIISQENFFKDALPFVTSLKIRGSWGKMGDDGASSFQFLTGYNYPSGNFVFNNNVVSGLGFRGAANPNITWFTATTKNLGIDLSLFNRKLSFEFDVFQRDRSGLLGTRTLSLPASVGAALPQENLNSDMRRGFELVVTHQNRVGELAYSVSGNVTYTRGKMTYIDRAPDGNSYTNWRNNTTDRWNNFFWGYNQIGQFKTQQEVYESPVQDGQGNRTLRPGNIKYEDLNHDGIIDAGDMKPIGRDNTPEIFFGLNVTLNWRKFDLAVFAQGAANFNIPWQFQMNPLNWGRNSMTLVFDRWHHEDIFDPSSPWVEGKYPPINWAPSDTWESTFWRTNASYLRLKNLEIGYTIENPSVFGKKILDRVRISASGFNVLTLTKEDLSARDPEQQVGGYPLTKSYNLGLSVTF